MINHFSDWRFRWKFCQDLLASHDPEKVTYTTGYAAYMFNRMSGKGVNMLGDVTSTAEHISVIEERHLTQALAALKVN